MDKQQIKRWLSQREHQRRLAVGLLTFAFGCFAQALWIEGKAQLAGAFGDPSQAMLTLVACYDAEAAEQDVAAR